MWITDFVYHPSVFNHGEYQNTISIPSHPELCLRINSHQCFDNVQQNLQQYHTPLGLKLHTVVGSLAYENSQLLHYQWGDPFGNCTINEDGQIDAHCWLEDSQGNIYDFIGEDQLSLANEATIIIANGKPTLLYGVSNPVCCSQLGLHYIATSLSRQQSILNFIHSCKMEID